MSLLIGRLSSGARCCEGFYFNLKWLCTHVPAGLKGDGAVLQSPS